MQTLESHHFLFHRKHFFAISDGGKNILFCSLTFHLIKVPEVLFIKYLRWPNQGDLTFFSYEWTSIWKESAQVKKGQDQWRQQLSSPYWIPQAPVHSSFNVYSRKRTETWQKSNRTAGGRAGTLALQIETDTSVLQILED